MLVSVMAIALAVSYGSTPESNKQKYAIITTDVWNNQKTFAVSSQITIDAPIRILLDVMIFLF